MVLVLRPQPHARRDAPFASFPSNSHSHMRGELLTVLHEVKQIPSTSDNIRLCQLGETWDTARAYWIPRKRSLASKSGGLGWNLQTGWTNLSKKSGAVHNLKGVLIDTARSVLLTMENNN